MKITNDVPTPEFDPTRKNGESKKSQTRSEPVGGVRSEGGGGNLKLSGRAQELLTYSQAADQVREAQHEHLEAIRLAVAESRYSVSAQTIADSMLKSLSSNPGGI